VPEYRDTVEGFPHRRGGLSISAPLALSVPVLFACTWVAFLVWILIRDHAPTRLDGEITVERVGLAVQAAVLVWLALRVARLERRMRRR
jgi:hypothetical protein